MLNNARHHATCSPVNNQRLPNDVRSSHLVPYPALTPPKTRHLHARRPASHAVLVYIRSAGGGIFIQNEREAERWADIYTNICLTNSYTTNAPLVPFDHVYIVACLVPPHIGCLSDRRGPPGDDSGGGGTISHNLGKLSNIANSEKSPYVGRIIKPAIRRTE